MTQRLALGCMTGTSLDALDIALVRATGHGGSLSAHIVRGTSTPLGDLTSTLRALTRQEPLAAGAIAEAALALGRLHAHAALELIGPAAAPGPAPQPPPLDLIAVHGQTVFHAPPLSWQLINPWPIARALGCPVVTDLRGSDLACDGQGAPITPLADWIFLRHLPGVTAVINLGGFCNITFISADASLQADPVHAPAAGLDVCPCNMLLDELARRALRAPYDDAGRRAAVGRPDRDALSDLLSTLDPPPRAAGPRSLGTGDEALHWLDRWLDRLTPEDLAATAAHALGTRIGLAARAMPTVTRSLPAAAAASRLILAGGGRHHGPLVEAIARAAGVPIEPPPQGDLFATFREAAAMAVLGLLAADGLPITLPGVTARVTPGPRAGMWIFPDSRPLILPEPIMNLISTDAPISPALPAHEPRPSPPDRGQVATEQRNPRTRHMHTLDTLACVRTLIEEDRAVVPAVDAAAGSIAAFLDDLIPRFTSGGRLITLGAGTSGRLAVLDAAELGPTFQLPPGRVVALIAGGDPALRRSSEGLEDDPDGALPDLLSLKISSRDTVLGLTAGGTTPYVLGGLHALAQGRLSSARPLLALLTCAPPAIPHPADHLILLPTGPEALAGSTRLKAGTATKLALNIISTTLMIRTGRVFENLMVDLRATNTKLRDRGARIIAELTGLPRTDALAMLDAAEGSVKLAILMSRGLSLPQARLRLAAAAGHLHAALADTPRGS